MILAAVNFVVHAVIDHPFRLRRKPTTGQHTQFARTFQQNERRFLGTQWIIRTNFPALTIEISTDIPSGFNDARAFPTMANTEGSAMREIKMDVRSRFIILLSCVWMFIIHVLTARQFRTESMSAPIQITCNADHLPRGRKQKSTSRRCCIFTTNKNSSGPGFGHRHRIHEEAISFHNFCMSLR